MAKLIFTSRYLRDVPAPRIEHYVRYIGTREGVEKMASLLQETEKGAG